MTGDVRPEHRRPVHAIQRTQPADILGSRARGDQPGSGDDTHVLSRTDVKDLDAGVGHERPLVDRQGRALHRAARRRTKRGDPEDPRLGKALMDGDQRVPLRIHPQVVAHHDVAHAGPDKQVMQSGTT